MKNLRNLEWNEEYAIKFMKLKFNKEEAYMLLYLINAKICEYNNFKLIMDSHGFSKTYLCQNTDLLKKLKESILEELEDAGEIRSTFNTKRVRQYDIFKK